MKVKKSLYLMTGSFEAVAKITSDVNKGIVVATLGCGDK